VGAELPSAAIVAVPKPSAVELLLSLPLQVDGYRLTSLGQLVGNGFNRTTTLFWLEGDGEEGVGEDVTYEPEDHELLHAAHQSGFRLELPRKTTLGGFCRQTEGLDLHPAPPRHPSSRRYRLWALHSAALDLALRQAGLSLHEALGLEPRPLRFVVSPRLADPPSAKPLRRLAERFPGVRLKLDPTPAWSAPLIAELAAGDRVDVLDLKAHYEGTVVDQRPSPELHRLLLEAFPRAVLEDPSYGPATAPLLDPQLDRVSYDAPLHGPADLDRLGHQVRIVNVKPSRLGSLPNLFAFLERCARESIRAYGGGQFELGPGRGQVQYLASLLYAEGPNDCAPAPYNLPEPPADLPESPLAVDPPSCGFRLG